MSELTVPFTSLHGAFYAFGEILSIPVDHVGDGIGAIASPLDEYAAVCVRRTGRWDGGTTPSGLGLAALDPGLPDARRSNPGLEDKAPLGPVSGIWDSRPSPPGRRTRPRCVQFQAFRIPDPCHPARRQGYFRTRCRHCNAIARGMVSAIGVGHVGLRTKRSSAGSSGESKRSKS